MIIVKIIISVLIVSICTYLGIYKAKTYEARERELKRIKSALIFFKSKIEFTYEPIKDIFMQISKAIYLHKDNVFLNTVNNLKDNSINLSWNNAVENAQNFNKEDKETLKMFGKLLGRTDKNGQLSEIDLSLDFIDKQIEKAEYEKNKNSKLYKSLGLLLGIGIVVILA